MSEADNWRTRSMHRIASFTRSTASSPALPTQYPIDMENLPLPSDIASSVQAFLKNVQSPIHKSPFSPERLTAMFQDFYAGTNELVCDTLPEDLHAVTPGEMLSNEEMAEQKFRRGQADVKRQQWREEIEERVCLELYDKIFELKTSDDELRDEALMSKIIAMNLIGVSLEQLGVGVTESEWQDMQPTITLIGEELQNLNNAFTPKAKIDILVACHKQIVAEVQHTNIAEDLAAAVDEGKPLPAISTNTAKEDRKHLGADAILPIFIFSIIKSNPAKLVSHFQFIQRFRASTMLAGEAAYCVTNLEAAIGFLETFDDSHPDDSDPLRVGLLSPNLKSSTSGASLSTSIRASERARALSSAAQDVYEFADERMKSLGSQFGLQLGALVGRVSQAQDLDDVRSLMGLPSVESDNTRAGPSDSTQQSLLLRKSANSLAKDFRSASPPKAATTLQTQNARVGGSFGRLAGLGVIRNLSNSFSQSRNVDTSQPSTRELQTLSNETPKPESTFAASISSTTSNIPLNPPINRKFLNKNLDELTIKDIKELLEEYKRIVHHIS